MAENFVFVDLRLGRCGRIAHHACRTQLASFLPAFGAGFRVRLCTRAACRNSGVLSRRAYGMACRGFTDAVDASNGAMVRCWSGSKLFVSVG